MPSPIRMPLMRRCPTGCSGCFTVNGSGSYPAIVLFAGRRLAAVGQVRNAPPDTDTRDQVDNYLEGLNESIWPLTSGAEDFEARAPAGDFNDRLFCIEPGLTVTECS